MNIQKLLEGKELKQDVLKMDGFDCACVGFDEENCRLNYSLNLIIAKLMQDEMTYLEAMEFYDYNIEASLGGKGMPQVIDDVY